MGGLGGLFGGGLGGKCGCWGLVGSCQLSVVSGNWEPGGCGFDQPERVSVRLFVKNMAVAIGG
jgi:hypothetical protein